MKSFPFAHKPTKAMADLHFQAHKPSIHSLTKKTKMAFSTSKFLTLFLLFSSLHLAFANEQVVDHVDPIAQSEIVGQRPPYTDCCNNAHKGNCVSPPNFCGGGDCSSPPCVQNGCGGVQNPGYKCCSGPGYQPSPPACSWQEPCPSCGCVKSDVKVEAEHESDHLSGESIPSKH